MSQHLIDWNLERAAEEAWYSNLMPSSEMERARREKSAMHLTCANALTEKLVQIGPLNV